MGSFNPRSRAGSDYDKLILPAESTGFNPRSRAGSDFPVFTASMILSVSIHAPARGATYIRQT